MHSLTGRLTTPAVKTLASGFDPRSFQWGERNTAKKKKRAAGGGVCFLGTTAPPALSSVCDGYHRGSCGQHGFGVLLPLQHSLYLPPDARKKKTYTTSMGTCTGFLGHHPAENSTTLSLSLPPSLHRSDPSIKSDKTEPEPEPNQNENHNHPILSAPNPRFKRSPGGSPKEKLSQAAPAPKNRPPSERSSAPVEGRAFAH